MPPAPTAGGVEANTPGWLNEELQQRAAASVEGLAAANGSVSVRLRALRREWDVERAIETEAPLMILAGVAAGALVDRRLLAVPAIAASMLLLHSLQGWYPLLPALRRLGMRTTREIAGEAYALKRQRGDFKALDPSGRPEDRAAQAWRAAGPRAGG